LLEPLQQDSPFQQAYIGFEKGKIIGIKMLDALGQTIHTNFSNVKINQKVNNQLFVFVPPKGVDVIQAGH
jgi:outer membrane lipoprotein carrier protein